MNGNLDPVAAAEGGRWWRGAHFLALLALCAAYIHGPLSKIFDFQAALAEMTHFGLLPTPFFAVAVIVFELAMSTPRRLFKDGRKRQ